MNYLNAVSLMMITGSMREAALDMQDDLNGISHTTYIADRMVHSKLFIL